VDVVLGLGEFNASAETINMTALNDQVLMYHRE